ncbi:MAG: LytR/AlgR family response regulator transcription factor [Eubacterium sp.]
MNIFICDDNKTICNQLENLLFDYFKKYKYSLPEITIFNSGDDMLNCSDTADIIFLDIEMPGQNGIIVGEKLHKTNPNLIVFIITSYMEYLDDAMRFHVFRYLNKPIDTMRLYRNLEDALKKYYEMSSTIVIENNRDSFTIKTSDIVMIETESRKTIIHTIDQVYTSTQNMSYWSSILKDSSFYCCNRSYIINMRYVSKYNNSTIYLCNDKYIAYLTKRKYSHFKSNYLMFLANYSY